MPFTRPTTVPLLDTNQTNRVAPAAGKITDGYVTNDTFPAGSGNYLMGWAGDWLRWMNERTEDGATSTRDLTFTGVDADGASGDPGGIATWTGGVGDGAGVGGLVSIVGGTGGATGNGGAVTIDGGAPGGAVGDGGDVSITAGTGGATSGDSGDVTIIAPDSVDGVAGSISITSGRRTGVSGAAGTIDITSGAASGAFDGGLITIAGGASTGGAARGGSVVVRGGDGGGLASQDGGNVTIRGGDAGFSGSAGGNVSFNGGIGIGAAAGTIDVTGGQGQGVVGGAASLAGGSSTSGVGGASTVRGGAGNGASTGGTASLIGGIPGITGIGGIATVTGGVGGATSGNGGAANITGGAASANNDDGGAVVIAGGARDGSGTDGNITLDANFVLLQSGSQGTNVAIGTTTPDVMLHLSDATGGAIIRLERDDTIIGSTNIIGAIQFEHQDADAAGVAAIIQGIAEGSLGEVGLTFHTGTGGSTSEQMRITNTGNVSIGETSPGSILAKFQVTSADSGVDPNNDADEGFFEGSGNSGITIGSGSTSDGNVFFARSGSVTQGGVSYDHNVDRLSFRVNNTIRCDMTDLLFNWDSLETVATNVVFRVITDETSPGVKFQILGDGDAENENNSYTGISDERAKKEIQGARDRFQNLMDLEVIDYKLKKHRASDPLLTGFTAQQMQTVFPELIRRSGGFEVPDDPKPEGQREKLFVANYIGLIPHLVAAIQRLHGRISALEAA